MHTLSGIRTSGTMNQREYELVHHLLPPPVYLHVVKLEYIANMSLSAPECICEAMEYTCTKIHAILSQKDREKEGDILFHVCTHAYIYSASVR